METDNPLSRQRPPEFIDFQQGAILLVNKPLGWTSFDVVNKIRYRLKSKLKVKNIKVGHAGTLDPMATGLLIICVGKYTKQIDTFQAQIKEYTGTIHLGATTPSFDLETEIDQTFDTAHIDESLIESKRQQFLGALEQIPPVFSAIKVDGKPLYLKAREGKEVEVKARPVNIYRFDITNIKMPEIDFLVSCSKGTYLRSLANDFGEALGSGAYLKNLCRTAIGDYRLENAWELDDLMQYIDTCKIPEPVF